MLSSHKGSISTDPPVVSRKINKRAVKKKKSYFSKIPQNLILIFQG
jgi:hypothetical protein